MKSSNFSAFPLLSDHTGFLEGSDVFWWGNKCVQLCGWIFVLTITVVEELVIAILATFCPLLQSWSELEQSLVKPSLWLQGFDFVFIHLELKLMI